MSVGVAEVKELARRGGGGYSPGGVACLPQEVSVPVLQLYSLIITSCSGGDRVASTV